MENNLSGRRSFFLLKLLCVEMLCNYYIFQIILQSGRFLLTLGLLLLSLVEVFKDMIQKTCFSTCWSVSRGEVVPGAAAPSILPSGSVGPMAEPTGVSVLANATPETLAHGQPGTLTVHPLWTSAA